MNILPKEDIEFSKADYWDKFFKERGSKKFEWYGEYFELSGELHKYVRPKDSILVVGCGNSRLSLDLYDVGYKDITNIDISGVVIKQMKNKLGKSRPEMIFEQMDALDMSFESEKFTVVLDKGTLDALMPHDSDEDYTRAGKLFSEINRILKIGGRYIIISLLQSHIMRAILNYFMENGWMVRIIRCQEVEKKNVLDNGVPGMPVFMIICTKLKKLPNVNGVLEANMYFSEKIQRISSKEEILSMVDSLQRALMQFRKAKDEIEIEFHRPNEVAVRYVIFIVDISPDQKVVKKYGAFIVPQGRENEWMFGTKEGRKYLLNESGFDRLAVITLQRGQCYKGESEIREELDRTILQFAPCYMESSEISKIPYLTIGDGLGRRETVFRTRSALSGEMIVEEVEVDGVHYRRLIFMDNQAVIQSEVKLQKDSKTNKWKISDTFTSNSLTNYMSMSVGIVRQPKSALVIGLGGGALCLLINKLYPSVKVTAVELDPVIVDVAKKFFGLKEGNLLKVVVENGVEYIRREFKHDIVIFDVDSKEQGSVMSSPPPQFLEPEVVNSVKKMIGKSGILVINVVSRVETAHEEFIKKMRKYFSLIAWYGMKEDVNRIVFLSNLDATEGEWQNLIISAAEDLNKSAKKKLKGDSLLDLVHLTTELTV